jgi:two-component system cell cycle response regulator
MDTRNSILIVDDDEKLLDIFKTALLLEGYRCEAAGSAEYALELINKIPFDILLTDIKMPGATGFELTEKAKKIRPDMSVIIMTAYIEEFAYNGAIEVGASDFIKKPFTMKELIARIQHVKRQEEIRALSFTDDLTGLYNRRGFFTLVEQQLKLFKRQMKGIYMLYADVDNLKEINDILGHKEGDMALIDVANILRKNYREADIIARIGGDEFVVIPVETTGDNIDIISSRLQKSLKLHNAEKNHKYKLSISVGIAYYNPENPCSVDDLLVRADKAMYEQKMLKKKS